MKDHVDFEINNEINSAGNETKRLNSELIEIDSKTEKNKVTLMIFFEKCK